MAKMIVHHRYAYLCSVACFFLLVNGISSRADTPEFEQKCDTESYNSSIIQDRDGFMWIVGAGGLQRYDGYELRSYKKGGENSPSSNLVASIFEDRDGLIWFTPFGDGLNCYDKSTNRFTRFVHAPTDPHSLSTNRNAWSNNLLAEDSKGRIWYGASNGLNCYDKTTQKFTHYLNEHGLSDNQIWSVFVDKQDRVWAGTESGGLNCLNTVTGRITQFVHAQDTPNSIGAGRVYDIIQDKDGVFWVGTSEGGLDRLNADGVTFTRYTSEPDNAETLSNNCVYNIYESRSGNLWTCGYYSSPRGIEVFDGSSGKVIHRYGHGTADKATLPGSLIMAFWEDRSGAVWIVDNLGPITLHNPNKLKIRNYQAGGDDKALTTNAVLSISEDKTGDLWLTYMGGLDRLRREAGVVSRYVKDVNSPDALQVDYVTSVLEDSSGRLWVATDDGIMNVFDRRTGKVLERHKNPGISKGARGLVENPTKPGELWYGTEGYGWGRFNAQNGTFINYRDIFADPALQIGQNVSKLMFWGDALWIATKDEGLFQFSPQSQEIRSYKHDKQNSMSISSNALNDLYVDHEGRFWIATDDSGLNLFDPTTGRFQMFGMESGFSTMSFGAIKEDDHGFLWISSDSGIFKFDTTRKCVVRRFVKGDGMCSEKFGFFAQAAIRSRDGYMWFAGTNGMVSFHPDELVDTPSSPPIHLTSLTQGGIPVALGMACEKAREVTINWDASHFEFEVTSLNYLTPTNNRYKYILDGVDMDWFMSGEKRFGRYAGLPSGKYVLRVVGAKTDGTWDDASQVVLRVNVIPPFWKTAWFYLLCAILIFLLFALIIAYIGKLNKEVEIRKSAEAALRDSQENLQATLNSIADGVIATDADGVVVSMNPVAERLTGWSLKAATEHKLNDVFIASNDRGESIDPFDAVISGAFGTNHLIELTMLSKSGDSYDILESGSVIRHADDTPSGVVVVFRDVSERKAIQQQLRHSQKMDSLGQLAGGIAHDFNNMLGGMLGFAELLSLELMHDKKLLEYAEAISNTANRATELTQKMLSFSRRGIPASAEVDLHPLIQETIDMLERTIDKKIVLQSNLAAAHSIIRGDASELQNSILNMAVNARDAMPGGGTLLLATDNVTITDSGFNRLGLDLSPGHYIELLVSDTGIGIAKEHQEKIFEPFFTTKDVGKGTGLGLAAVYGAIKEHSGNICVESELAKGTTFRIYLPVSELESLPHHEHGSPLPEVVRQSGSVLVVDDEEVNRNFLKVVLSKMGFQVIIASDGSSALDHYKSHPDPIDFVFMDMIMPVMNGEECFYKLREINPDIKVFLCTGFAGTSSVSQMIRDGLKGVIRKPFGIAAITKAISEN